MIVVMMLASTGLATASVQDDVSLNAVQVTSYNALGPQYSNWNGNGQTSPVSGGSYTKYFQATIYYKGTVTESDMYTKCFVTIDLSYSGGAVIQSFSSNTSSKFTMYFDSVDSTVSLNTWTYNVTIDQSFDVTTKLYAVEGGVTTLDTVWVDHIGESSAVTYDDLIVEATYVHDGTYDHLYDGGSFTTSGSYKSGYIATVAVHGNGTIPMGLEDRDSYVKLIITDPEGKTVLTRTSYELSSVQLTDPSYYRVTHNYIGIPPSVYKMHGDYEFKIEFYTQVNDYTGFVLQDTWTMTINIPEEWVNGADQDAMGLIGLSLGGMGLLFFVVGPIFGIYISRHADAMNGIIICLMTMIIGGVLVYVFMLGGE
jgi:hypothetical protein